MSQIQLIEVLCYFNKRGKTLELAKWIKKDWFPDASESGPFQLGLHRIGQDQLNRLQITFEDETKLQCVLFHKEDEHNWQYGTRTSIRSQLIRLTGCQAVRMTLISTRGRSQADLVYIPLRDSREYAHFFSRLDHLRNFKVGDTMAEYTLLNGVPLDLPEKADTLIITDSFLENLDFLQQYSDLKSLSIERCIVNNWEFLGGMKNLENLFIETGDIPDSGIVQDLNKLRRLALVDCDLVEVEGLSGKPALIFCDLSNNRELQSVDALKASAGLQWLIVENAQIRRMDLIHWQELTVLEICFNCMIELKNLHTCKELKLNDSSFNWFKAPTLLDIFRLVNKNGLLAFDLHGDRYLTEDLH